VGWVYLLSSSYSLLQLLVGLTMAHPLLLPLFTGVRGRGILGSPQARSCIPTPPTPQNHPLQTPRIAPPASPKGPPPTHPREDHTHRDMSDIKIFIAMITVFTVLVFTALVIGAFIPRGYPQTSGIFPRSCHA
jgi:hypothetical protein